MAGSTKTIKNITDSPVDVVIYSSQFGEGRRTVTIASGKTLNVNRITPEAAAMRAAEDLAIVSAGHPLPAIRHSEVAKPAPSAPPKVPYTLVSMGHSWRGDAPAAMSYVADLEMRASTRSLALLFPNASNGDIDWWNCDIGPWVRHAKVADGDFEFAASVAARGAFLDSPGNDWMGLIICKEDDPFHFLRLAALRRVYGDKETATHIFEILCQQGHGSEAQFQPTEVVGLANDPVLDWESTAALVGETALQRTMDDERDVYPMSIERSGADIIVSAQSAAGAVNRTIRNFFLPSDRLFVGVAIGRYVTQGSRFIGAEFTDLVSNW